MKILYVEDDDIIASGLVYALKAEGYEVIHCKDYKTTLETLGDKTFSLALLDLSLPDGNGFDICAEVKARLGIPVIFLTVVDDEANTVKGLESGADDYIIKPFRLKELMARLRAVLRRSVSGEENADIVILSGVEINTRQAKVFKDGIEIQLTAIEYRLLLALATHKGQVLSRSQILDMLWDSGGNFVNDNTLTVNIKRLREKLSDDPQYPRIIQTVRGLGYRAGEA